MKIKNISLALLALFAFVSCSEDEVKLFDAVSGINLGIVDQTIPTTASDTLVSIDFGFLDSRIIDSTRLLRCKLQGMPVGYDRVIKLKCYGTAIPSVDFEIVNECIVKAGKIDADVKVKLRRENLEKGGKKRLTIELIPTEELVNGVISRVHFDFADEVPLKWINELYGMMGTYNFGPCSKIKYRFFFDTLGFYDLAPVAMGDYTVIKNVLRLKLDDYNVNPDKYDNKYGPSPLMDDDGVTLVSF